MMSSETSTKVSASPFRPWHLFTLAGLLAATVGVLVVRPDEPAALVLLVLAIGAAAGVGFGLYRTLGPLADRTFSDEIPLVGGTARAALEREKVLVLRSIKELEFDRAMGKVSEQDFTQMGERLRARAIALMKQLDVDVTDYREAIERELATRLEASPDADDVPAPGESARTSRAACDSCGASNEPDARFCKRCGQALTPDVGEAGAEEDA